MSITTAQTLSGNAVVQQAYTWLGVPYLWAGGRGSPQNARSNGVDCSGLVYQVFMALGVNPGTDTVSQMNNPAAQVVPDLSSAAPGDLIFFGSPTGGANSHVGIYIGNGLMIDAPHTGASTRIDKVVGFENLLGIRRVTAPGTLLASTPGIPGTAAPTSSTASTSSTLGRTFVEIVAVAGALGLVVLGVLRTTKGARPQ